MNWTVVGIAIQDRRDELGLSQETAAERAGISPNTWINAETARLVNGPTPATLTKIEEVLELKHGYLRGIATGEHSITAVIGMEERVARLEEQMSALLKMLGDISRIQRQPG